MSNFSFEPLKLKLATNNIIIPMENGVADLTNAETSAKIMLAGKELFPIFDESIGGRNLVKTVRSVSFLPTYNVTATKSIIDDATVPSGFFLRLDNYTKTGSSDGFYFPGDSSHYTESPRGKLVTISFYMRGDIPFLLLGLGGIEIGTEWTKVVTTRVWGNTGNLHIFYTNADQIGLKTMDLSSIKIEKGNNPNPIWTPAPEEVLQNATLSSYNCSAAIVDDLVKITSHKPDTKRGWVDVTVNYGNLSNTKRVNWSVEGVEVYKPTGTLLTMNNRGIKL